MRLNKTNKRKTKNNQNNKKKTTKKIKTKKIKGGTLNPFSDFFGLFGTMTYNLSNALSTFTITPPPAYLNSSENPVNPSPSKQFLSAKA
jgi:hypothetical protein